MLVLSRKPNQDIHIGNNIVIKVVRVNGNRVTLGIQAPDHVTIKRGELCEFDCYDFSEVASLGCTPSTDLDSPALQHDLVS